MHRNSWSALFSIPALALVLHACGGGKGDENGSKARGNEARSSPTKEWNSTAGTATIHGRAVFNGDAPKRRELQMGADPKCAGLHSDPVLDESVVVGEGGGLANVFVWVKSGLEDYSFSTPSQPAALAQDGCVFKPHVLGMMVGQGVEITNKDPVSHNVRCMTELNSSFNFSQNSGVEDHRDFTSPELPVRIKCDMHGWMGCYVGVFEHPFFIVTGADGKFEFPKLPAGKYTIEAWHEALEPRTLEVTIADNETRELAFEFEDE